MSFALTLCDLEPKEKPESVALKYIKHCLNEMDSVASEACIKNRLVQPWACLTPFVLTTTQKPHVCIVGRVHSGEGPRAYEVTTYKEVVGLVTPSVASAIQIQP